MQKDISCCGVICSECNMYPDKCAGCIAVKGVAYWTEYAGIDVCPIYKCCIGNRHFSNCGQCEKLPCEKYYEHKDPDMTDEEHRQTVTEMVKVLKSLK